VNFFGQSRYLMDSVSPEAEMGLLGAALVFEAAPSPEPNDIDQSPPENDAPPAETQAVSGSRKTDVLLSLVSDPITTDTGDFSQQVGETATEETAEFSVLNTEVLNQSADLAQTLATLAKEGETEPILPADSIAVPLTGVSSRDAFLPPDETEKQSPIAAEQIANPEVPNPGATDPPLEVSEPSALAVAGQDGGDSADKFEAVSAKEGGESAVEPGDEPPSEPAAGEPSSEKADAAPLSGKAGNESASRIGEGWPETGYTEPAENEPGPLAQSLENGELAADTEKADHEPLSPAGESEPLGERGDADLASWKGGNESGLLVGEPEALLGNGDAREVPAMDGSELVLAAGERAPLLENGAAERPKIAEVAPELAQTGPQKAADSGPLSENAAPPCPEATPRALVQAPGDEQGLARPAFRYETGANDARPFGSELDRDRPGCVQMSPSPPQARRSVSWRSPRHIRRPLPPRDSPTVATLSTQFLTGKPVDCLDPEMLAVTVLDLEDHRDDLMAEGRFIESLRAQKAVDDAREQQLTAVKKRTQDETLHDLHGRQEFSHEKQEKMWEQLREWEQGLEQKVEKQRGVIVERHEKERQDHDLSWQKEPKQRRWNRSSQQLRILRVQQTMLMNARRFEEAADICRIADALAAAEAKESHFQMGGAYYQSRRLLDRKHEQELDTFDKACDVRRGELKYLREVWDRRFTNRDAALDFELGVAQDLERLWILRHRNEGDQIMAAIGGIRPNKRFVRPVNVSEFNTLELPTLPPLTGRRRVRSARDELLPQPATSVVRPPKIDTK
jgi:hypothetical protein